MTKKFFVVGQRDAADAFVCALQGAGYTRTYAGDFDFLLIDKEPTCAKRQAQLKAALNGRPMFVYPHTPYAWWLWDGILEPMPVACNFVVGQVAVDGMKAYGYPCRVEAVGFPRCEVRPLRPTTGRTLLYSSARLLNRAGAWPHPPDRDLHMRAMKWIVCHRKHFDRIIINYSYSLEKNCLDGFTGYGFEFRDIGDHRKLCAASAAEQFAGADVVITCNTFGFLALASGVPTVLFGHNQKDGLHSSAAGLHHSLYAEAYDFPLDLFSMSGAQVLALRSRDDPEVGRWKAGNIGTSFDNDKFVAIIEKIVS